MDNQRVFQFGFCLKEGWWTAKCQWDLKASGGEVEVVVRRVLGWGGVVGGWRPGLAVIENPPDSPPDSAQNLDRLRPQW